MKILFLSMWYPYPPDNGSKLRIFNLLRGLAEVNEVTLLSLTEKTLDHHPTELAELCSSIRTVPRIHYESRRSRAVLGIFNTTPRFLIDTYSQEMANAIEETLRAQQYDLIIASQWSTAAYWQKFDGIPAIFEELELGALHSKLEQADGPVAKARHRLPLLKLRLYLRRMLPGYGACTVVSEQEKEYLMDLIADYEAVEIVPNAVDLDFYRDINVAPVPNSMIFTGPLAYFANHQAMDWFLNKVFPQIKERVPDARLTITGDVGGGPLPTGEGVEMPGRLADIRPSIASSWLSIAPLFVGGGTRLKILESMALGTPVVATSKGAEGLDAKPDEHLLIADTPDTFADQSLRLMADPELRNRLGENARQLVRQRYDWQSVLPRFNRLTEAVVKS